MGNLDVIELAANMRPTRGFLNESAVIEVMETSVAIGLQNAAEAAQVLFGMIALAIWRVTKPNGRRSRIVSWTAIAHVSPKASEFSLALSRCQHWNRRVIGVQLVRVQYMATHSLDQRFQ